MRISPDTRCRRFWRFVPGRRGRSEARQGPADAQGRRSASAAQGDQVADRGRGEGVREGQGVRGRVLGHLVRAVRRHDAAPGRHAGRTRTKGVTFIGFTAKDASNTPEKVSQFVDEAGRKLGYTIAYSDDRETYDAYMKAAGQGGIPCSFVIGKDGKIAYIGHPLFLDEVLPKVLDGTWDPVKGKAELEAADKLWDATYAAISKPGDPVEAAGRVGGVLRQVAAAGGRPVHERRPVEATGGGQAVRRGAKAGRGGRGEGGQAK